MSSLADEFAKATQKRDAYLASENAKKDELQNLITDQNAAMKDICVVK